MRKWAFAVATTALLACALPAIADDGGDLRKLSWIAGCWTSDGGEGQRLSDDAGQLRRIVEVDRT